MFDKKPLLAKLEITLDSFLSQYRQSCAREEPAKLMAANKAHPEALGAEVGLVVVCGPCVTEIKQSVASFRAKFANSV